MFLWLLGDFGWVEVMVELGQECDSNYVDLGTCPTYTMSQYNAYKPLLQKNRVAQRLIRIYLDFSI